MNDEEILAGLIMGARAERDLGFKEGWTSPPELYHEQCDRLCVNGFAERWDDRERWYRPTAEGERVYQIKISRVQ
jgi:hypothetical protein